MTGGFQPQFSDSRTADVSQAEYRIHESLVHQTCISALSSMKGLTLEAEVFWRRRSKARNHRFPDRLKTTRFFLSDRTIISHQDGFCFFFGWSALTEPAISNQVDGYTCNRIGHLLDSMKYTVATLVNREVTGSRSAA